MIKIMKKIAILALHLGAGGVENVISNVANILCNDYDIEIISTYKLSETPFFDIDNKVKITYLTEGIKPNKEELKESIKKFKVVNIFKEIYKGFKTLYLKRKTMIEAIKNIDADIVISTRALHSKLLGKYGNKNIIKIAQEHNHHNNNKKYIRKVVNSVRNMDYFMPVSNELKTFYAEKLKNTKIKVEYIPNCLDIFPERVSSLDEKNIISVGRLSPEKGFDDLIDVFEIVNSKHPDWSLNIVGGGVLFDYLKNKINQKNLEGIINLTGFKDKNELSELYLNSSIYVMTSWTESFGLVLAEAGSYGIPLLAFEDAGGPKEIIHEGKNGFLISNRDKEEMANKICMLIEDVNLRDKLGREARKLAENFKKDNISNIWLSFIRNILNEGSSIDE